MVCEGDFVNETLKVGYTINASYAMKHEWSEILIVSIMRMETTNPRISRLQVKNLIEKERFAKQTPLSIWKFARIQAEKFAKLFTALHNTLVETQAKLKR